MRHFLPTIVWACVCAGMLTGANAAEPAEGPIKVFAAGSLTGALTAVIKLYQEKTGVQVQAEFGPAGLLRERIESGEHPDIFASANMAHPQALADKGEATIPIVMARNRFCARALPGFGLTTANLFDRMLDPKTVGIGTSTPKAVTADYGLSVLGHREAALRFALFVMSPEAQHVIGLYGFTPVAQSQAAH